MDTLTHAGNAKREAGRYSSGLKNGGSFGDELARDGLRPRVDVFFGVRVLAHDARLGGLMFWRVLEWVVLFNSLFLIYIVLGQWRHSRVWKTRK